MSVCLCLSLSVSPSVSDVFPRLFMSVCICQCIHSSLPFGEIVVCGHSPHQLPPPKGTDQLTHLRPSSVSHITTPTSLPLHFQLNHSHPSETNHLPSIHLPIHPNIHLTIPPSIHPSIHPSIQPITQPFD